MCAGTSLAAKTGKNQAPIDPITAPKTQSTLGSDGMPEGGPPVVAPPSSTLGGTSTTDEITGAPAVGKGPVKLNPSPLPVVSSPGGPVAPSGPTSSGLLRNAEIKTYPVSYYSHAGDADIDAATTERNAVRAKAGYFWNASSSAIKQPTAAQQRKENIEAGTWFRDAGTGLWHQPNVATQADIKNGAKQGQIMGYQVVLDSGWNQAQAAEWKKSQAPAPTPAPAASAPPPTAAIQSGQNSPNSVLISQSKKQ